MSERKVVARYRSSGQPAAYEAPEEPTARNFREARVRGHSGRDQQVEEILAHRESLQNQDPHGEAVQHFDVRFKDLHEPALLREVLIERQRRIEEAAKQGGVQDWETFYRDVGNTVRKKIGRPALEEEERFEIFRAARGARGLE